MFGIPPGRAPPARPSCIGAPVPRLGGPRHGQAYGRSRKKKGIASTTRRPDGTVVDEVVEDEDEDASNI